MIHATQPTAASVMRRNVVTLSPDDSIDSALNTFEEERIGGAPVVGAGHELLGVLTLSDVLRAEHVRGDQLTTQRGGFEMSEPAGEELGDELDPDEVFFVKEDYSARLLERTLVADWMTPEVFSVRSDASLREVCEAMVNQRVHRMFVTEGKKLLGIVTSFDVVRAIAGGGTPRRRPGR